MVAILCVCGVVFQQEAGMVTVGQTASGRRANSDLIHEGSLERHSTKARGGVAGKWEWRCGSPNISSGIFSIPQVRL